jgi:hypothetical protein
LPRTGVSTCYSFCSRSLFLGEALSDFNEVNSKNVSLRRIVIHPGWNTANSNYYADIAVVVLSETFEFVDGLIKPVCLPQPEEFKEIDSFGIGKITGWGRSHYGEKHTLTPKELDIPVIEASHCVSTFPKLAEITSNSSFCSGYEKKGKGACTGETSKGADINKSRVIHFVSVPKNKLSK